MDINILPTDIIFFDNDRAPMATTLTDEDMREFAATDNIVNNLIIY